jgi:hypothetical protein
MAAGEDCDTGSQKLDELLDRIHRRQEKPLTLQETASLRDVIAGKFRRRRGQRPNDTRHYRIESRQQLWEWLHRIKRQLQKHPEEQRIKRAMRAHHEPYDIGYRTAKVAHAILDRDREREREEQGAKFTDYKVRSVEALHNLLKRGPPFRQSRTPKSP